MFMEKPYLTYGKNVSEAAQKAGFTQEQIANIGNLTRTFKSQNLTIVDFSTKYAESDEAEVGKLYYVVMDKPVKNTRSKPYKVTHNSANGKRAYKLMYQIVDMSSIPYLVYGSKPTKQEAISSAKDICRNEQKDISIVVVKEVISNDSVAAEIKYTPSKNMREGSYFFFVVETDWVEVNTDTEMLAEVDVEEINESL